MPTNSFQYQTGNQTGTFAYEFGFNSDLTPTITGFICRTADLRLEAETFEQARDNMGLTRSVITTRPSKKKISGTFVGYINSFFHDGNNDSQQHSFRFPPISQPDSRFYVIKSISHPRRKGEFSEVTIEAESYFYVTDT